MIDQRVDRLAQRRHGLRALVAADRRLGPRRRAVRGAFAERYSSLTSSMSDDTAVLRCMRSSMSVVTRLIV